MKRHRVEDADHIVQNGPKRLPSAAASSESFDRPSFFDTVLQHGEAIRTHQNAHSLDRVLSRDESSSDSSLSDFDDQNGVTYDFTSTAPLSSSQEQEDQSTESDGSPESPQNVWNDSPLPPRDFEYVCYGMINEISCRPLRSAKTYDYGQLPRVSTDNNFARVNLEIGREKCIVTDPDGFPLLLMNSKAFNALKEVMSSGEVHIDAFAVYDEISKLYEHSGSYNHSTGLRSICVHANFYGPEFTSSAVGASLSRYEAYLQIPQHMRPETVHRNPHVIAFEGVSESDIWLQQLQSMLPSSAASATLDWTSVLDDLPQYQGSGDGADTKFMKTELLRHQLVAQNYMSRREGGQLEHDMKFWLLESSDQGVPIYRHVVTGEEVYDDPTEPQGGILADHMGLGKTLSSISLIAGSLDRAAAFANGPPTVVLNGTTPLANCRATLVIVPSVLLMEEWEKEVAKHTEPDTLQITRYHGQDRAKRFSNLREYDIVLTTYGTVTKEFTKLYVQGREALFHIRWFRIILDEAHTIRSTRTRQFEATISLQGQYHWALTGTPVSNKIEDLEALLRFCRVPLLQNHDCFRNNVTKVAKRSFPQACRILRQTLSPICLRRTKALLDIPEPRTVEYVLDFSEPEREMYKKLETYFRDMINASVSRKGGAYNAMFKAILQLRIACDQGTHYQMPKDGEFEEGLDPDEALTLLEEREEAFCVKCSAEVSSINQPEQPGCIWTCGHVLCGVCFEVFSHQSNQQHTYHCPTCNQEVTQRKYNPHQVLLNEDMDFESRRCAKMERLLEDLLETRWKGKTIVFSVWTRTLDLAAQMCDRNGIAYVRVDGRVPQRDRTLALERFSKNLSENGSVSVLLMTLGTGALGLNLTAASTIVLLEAQWNPSVEDQAIGRAIRIGQEREATIIRYLVRNSVEEQIQSYQRKKRNLVAGGFGDAFKHTEGDSTSLTSAMLE